MLALPHVQLLTGLFGAVLMLTAAAHGPLMTTVT